MSLQDGKVTPLGAVHEHWDVNLIDSGDETNTGGRLKRLAPWLHDETFMLTYGDGVSDLDVKRLVAFHGNTGNSPRSRRFVPHRASARWSSTAPTSCASRRSPRWARDGSTVASWS